VSDLGPADALAVCMSDAPTRPTRRCRTATPVPRTGRRHFRSSRQQHQGAEGLEALAAVAAARAEPDRAVRLSGAAAAATRETIASRPTFEVAITGRFVETVQRTVSQKRWHESWGAGRAL